MCVCFGLGSARFMCSQAIKQTQGVLHCACFRARSARNRSQVRYTRWQHDSLVPAGGSFSISMRGTHRIGTCPKLLSSTSLGECLDQLYYPARKAYLRPLISLSAKKYFDRPDDVHLPVRSRGWRRPS